MTAHGFIGPRPACELCGGTANMLKLRSVGVHSHYLCRARAEGGQATPLLGHECPECLGAGCRPRSALGPCNPSQAAMEAWAPTCARCGGCGAVDGESAVEPRRAYR